MHLRIHAYTHMQTRKVFACVCVNALTHGHGFANVGSVLPRYGQTFVLQLSWCQTYCSALLWTTSVRPRGGSCRLGNPGSPYTFAQALALLIREWVETIKRNIHKWLLIHQGRWSTTQCMDGGVQREGCSLVRSMNSGARLPRS